MQRKKCAYCGLVNIASNENCIRCMASLSAPPPRQSVKLWLPLWSVNGIGVKLYDQQKVSDEVFTAMRWITILYIPIVPLSKISFSPVEWEGIGGMYESMKLSIHESSAPDLKRVLRVYGIFSVGVLPLVLSFVFFDRFFKGIGPEVGTAILIALVIWFVLVLFKLENDKIDYGSLRRENS